MERDAPVKPRVGVSRCLLGAKVRYDGGHKLEPPLVEILGPHVEWVDVCPEVEVGMGVPREPVRLVEVLHASGSHRLRMQGVHSGRDWTEQMAGWTDARLRELAALDLAGYVLKARSPSCGLRDVPIHPAAGPEPSRGRGLFADALVAAFPGLPVEDEDTLRGADLLRAFLDRVTAFHARSRRRSW